jgi:hypothetical protein
MTILFLDLDGVMHPVGGDVPPLEYAPLLVVRSRKPRKRSVSALQKSPQKSATNWSLKLLRGAGHRIFARTLKRKSRSERRVRMLRR